MELSDELDHRLEPEACLSGSDLRTGDVLFLHGSDLESQIVTSASGSSWSHVGTVLNVRPETILTFAEFAKNVPRNWKDWATKIVSMYSMDKHFDRTIAKSVAQHVAETIVAVLLIKNNVQLMTAVQEECKIWSVPANYNDNLTNAQKRSQKFLYLWESTTSEEGSAQNVVTKGPQSGVKLTDFKVRAFGYESPIGVRSVGTKLVLSPFDSASARSSSGTSTAKLQSSSASEKPSPSRPVRRRFSRSISPPPYRSASAGKSHGDKFEIAFGDASEGQLEGTTWLDPMPTCSTTTSFQTSQFAKTDLSKTLPLTKGSESKNLLKRTTTTAKLLAVSRSPRGDPENKSKPPLRTRSILLGFFANMLSNWSKPYEEKYEDMASACCYDDCSNFQPTDETGNLNISYYLGCCCFFSCMRNAKEHSDGEYDSFFCSEITDQLLKDFFLVEQILDYQPSTEGILTFTGNTWESVDVAALTASTPSKKGEDSKSFVASNARNAKSSPRIADITSEDPFSATNENLEGMSDMNRLAGDCIKLNDYDLPDLSEKARAAKYRCRKYSPNWKHRELNPFYLLDSSPNDGGSECYILSHQLLAVLLTIGQTEENTTVYPVGRSKVTPEHLTKPNYDPPFDFGKLRTYQNMTF